MGIAFLGLVSLNTNQMILSHVFIVFFSVVLWYILRLCALLKYFLRYVFGATLNETFILRFNASDLIRVFSLFCDHPFMVLNRFLSNSIRVFFGNYSFYIVTFAWRFLLFFSKRMLMIPVIHASFSFSAALSR
jgi:hypothetical protein